MKKVFFLLFLIPFFSYSQTQQYIGKNGEIISANYATDAKVSDSLRNVIDYTTISSVSEFAAFNKYAKTVVVTDTLRGGFFNIYTGSDTADNGMIFLDALGRKWLRKVEGNAINIRWYGLNPYNNYAVDDAPVFRVAIDYIHKHANTFTQLYCPRGTPDNNSWYLLGSTLTLQEVELIGDGLQQTPLTLFQVLPDVKAFYIPALNHVGSGNHVNVTNIAVRHYDPVTSATNNHSFDIRCFVNFTNVNVVYNKCGNAFNIIACGSALDSTRGNSDHSNFSYCQGNSSLNGLYIFGCDANIMNFSNCSWVSNKYWGSYDKSLLGNIYINNHWSNNGKEGDCSAIYAGLYYIAEDSTNNVGKRPDLHPEYWYPVSFAVGAATWDTTRLYHSGGVAAVIDINAFSKFISPYTEYYQPGGMLLNARSTTEGGDNPNLIRGGLNIHPVDGVLLVDNNLHNGGIVTDRLYAGPTPVGNNSIHANTVDYYAMLLESSGQTSVQMQMKNTTSGNTGGLVYVDSVLVTRAGSDYSTAHTKWAMYPYNSDNVIDLGKSSLRFKDVYAGLSEGAGTKSVRVNPATGRFTYADTTTGSGLPSQTGNSGKYLTTNGTVPSWAALAGGGDLLAANNLSDVASAATSRTNLGLAIGTDVLAPSGNGSALTGITASQVGLGNVDNTSDANKPVSTATQTALNLKQDILKTKNLSWSQSGGGTTITAWGPAQTATGTATAVTQLTTNDYTYNPRLEYLVTVAATTAVAGWRSGSAVFNMGTTSTNGGLNYYCIWGNATGAATATTRCFVGIQASTSAPTDVEPSTLVNMFGVGWGAADANMQFFHNDGSGAATAVDLGADFPVPTSDRSAGYRLEMTTVSNSSTVNYTLTNIITLTTISGSVSTNLPANSVFLGDRGYMSVGGTSSVIGIAFRNKYIQAPYF